MAGVNVTVKVNMNGIGEKLLGIEEKIARRLLRDALKSVGTFWVAEAKSRVPVVNGDLKDSIKAKVSTRKASEKTNGLPSGEVLVGPTMMETTVGRIGGQNPGVYGRFVEFGLKNRKYKLHPFLRPTFDETGEQAVNVFAETLTNGFEEAIRE